MKELATLILNLFTAFLGIFILFNVDWDITIQIVIIALVVIESVSAFISYTKIMNSKER